MQADARGLGVEQVAKQGCESVVCRALRAACEYLQKPQRAGEGEHERRGEVVQRFEHGAAHDGRKHSDDLQRGARVVVEAAAGAEEHLHAPHPEGGSVEKRGAQACRQAGGVEQAAADGEDDGQVPVGSRHRHAQQGQEHAQMTAVHVADRVGDEPRKRAGVGREQQQEPQYRAHPFHSDSDEAEEKAHGGVEYERPLTVLVAVEAPGRGVGGVQHLGLQLVS